MKNKASAERTASYQDKKQVSSKDKLCKSKRKRGKKKSSPHASGVKSASQHTDKNQDSSNVRQAKQPKLKTKKTAAQVARDSARGKAFWKHTKVSRQLRAKIFATNYAKLQETRMVASPQVSAVSHPESSGACLDTTSSVSAVKQSSILLNNSEDSEGECTCCLKTGNQTEP